MVAYRWRYLERTSRVLLIGAAMLGASRVSAADPDFDSERERIERELEDTKQRVRVLEERLRQLEVRRAHASASSTPRARFESVGASACDWPFFLDSAGLKRLRPECAAEKRSACDYPFIVGPDGIKRLRATCSDAEQR